MFDISALITSTVLAAWNGPGWWIVFIPLGWFLVIAAFVFLLRLFVFRRGGWGPGWGCGSGGARYGGPLSADDVLARRFAEGELTVDEYRERHAVLRDSPPSG